MAEPTKSMSPVNAGTPAAPQEITSAALFQGRRELVILHNTQRYLLRITSNQKLILTR